MRSALPSDINSLVRLAGASQARHVMKRLVLLRRRLRRRRFSADPSRRIKEVEKALREQAEMKARLRLNR